MPSNHNPQFVEFFKSRLEELYGLVDTNQIFNTMNSQLLKLAETHETIYVDKSFNEVPKVDWSYQDGFFIDELQKQFDLGNFDHKFLTELVLTLGNPKETIRDRFALARFGGLISRRKLSVDETIDLIQILIDDSNLFEDIEFFPTPAVYGRSFSIMVLSMIFTASDDLSSMSEDLWNEFLVKYGVYSLIESDGRGYADQDNESGWIHAYFHIANLTDALIHRGELSDQQKLFIFATTLAGYHHLDQPLVMGEDRRFVEMIVSAVNENPLLRSYFEVVMREWNDDIKEQKIGIYEEWDWHRLYNLIRLRDHLLLQIDAIPKDLQDIIVEVRGTKDV